ncbi:MAG: hypothetical protein HOE76_03105 [Euryarchaeota archaeon]|jgi:hypothetical protein|nr:hypothetical protein [Euryarchaeota archaeon]MBT4981948.1 hypothetical protein [Euryarchaeota archaeon]MBT5184700.1 hypothetical protein [Euryarchaeota archaeon]
MEREEYREDWALSTISWYAVFVWFGASLFSQVAYLAINGVPYDTNIMLDAAGSFAWIIIGIELLVWGIIACLLIGKFLNRISNDGHEIVSTDTIAPQA